MDEARNGARSCSWGRPYDPRRNLNKLLLFNTFKGHLFTLHYSYC